MSHSHLEEEEFPEPEDSDAEQELKHENEEEEEEEDKKDIVVIDDEFLQQLETDIQKGNPVKLAQAVDIILGALELRDNIIFDEDSTINPLVSILPPLVTKVNEIYEDSLGKNAQKRKITQKMLTDLVQVYDLFDKFKGNLELLHSFLETVFVTRYFVDKSDVSKALSKASNTSSSNQKVIDLLHEYFARFADDPKFAPIIFKLRYIDFTNSFNKIHLAAADSLESLIDFYLTQPEKAKSYVKSIIQSFSAQLINCMSRTDKSLFSWHTIGLIEFITSFTIKSDTKCFITPIMTDLFVLLRNFPMATYLPFQLHVARCVAKLSHHFDQVTPLLNWAVDAIALVCSFQCKGSGRFAWDKELTCAPHSTYEFAEEVIDKLSKIVLQQLTEQSENIAFPEYAQSARRKLEEITVTGKNDRLRLKPKGLIKTIIEQQEALIELKKGLKWNTRSEQISAWKPAISSTKTPMKESEERSKAVDMQIANLKAQALASQKAVVDEAGDTLQAVTADNFMD